MVVSEEHIWQPLVCAVGLEWEERETHTSRFSSWISSAIKTEESMMELLTGSPVRKASDWYSGRFSKSLKQATKFLYSTEKVSGHAPNWTTSPGFRATSRCLQVSKLPLSVVWTNFETSFSTKVLLIRSWEYAKVDTMTLRSAWCLDTVVSTSFSITVNATYLEWLSGNLASLHDKHLWVKYDMETPHWIV